MNTQIAAVLIIFALCGVESEPCGLTEEKPGHGMIGLRPLPAIEAHTRHEHVGSWEEVPT